MIRSRLAATLCLLLFPAVPLLALGAEDPPLLPSPLSLKDLTVGSGTQRIFDLAFASTDKGFGWEIATADPGRALSGTLEFALVGGPVLRTIPLDGAETWGGYLDLSSSIGAKRVQLRLLGGPQDMRLDFSIPGPSPDLKQGQAVAVFSERTSEPGYKASRQLRLSRRSSVDLVTWGGDAEVQLEVHGPIGEGGFPPRQCDDRGDAWRHCRLESLEPGRYAVTVTGKGNPIQLLGRWQAAD
ncbi:hypothetical protein [Stenotrophomonas tumulicola]|uniref:Uncharacterized protein n=1 Tax=Stenotrophomonas tumulicola TaxID=1685415 RepID=A0A7W3IJ10_9GAMM|nr:hypothetical protein [Stenotrophomonas tumulicola]MBA8682806.1 hypothetical protein [Stenotrophomonas tumulicola]